MAKKPKVQEFIGYSVGLLALTKAHPRPVLAKAEFTLMSDGSVRLNAINGHTGGEMGRIRHVFLSADQWSERPADPYDYAGKAVWALRLLGFEVPGVPSEQTSDMAAFVAA